LGVYENAKNILAELPPSVTLVAAVKYATPEQIKELISAGITELGFNTYQHMLEVKNVLSEELLSKVNFHFIGHLQSNKVRKVMKLGVRLIQSVDSYKLARKISLVGVEEGILQGVLVQVKTDESKDYGVLPSELEDFLLLLKDLKSISVQGLMTIPPFDYNAEHNRKYFALTRNLFEKACALLGRRLEYLSMGMSDDYKIALEEGANMIRLGRILYK